MPNYDPKVLAQLEKYLPVVELRRKIRQASADMSSLVRIDEDHNYTVVRTGTWLAGTTSISGLVPKDWLAAWGSKETARALGYSDFPEDTAVAEETLAKIKALKTVKEYQALLKEAKGAAAKKSKDALIDGKVGHAWAETYVLSKINNTKAPAIPKGMLERPLTQFVEWAEANVELWILSEALVCNIEKGYAGTLDAVAILKDERLALVDFKFASHISPEYYLQTAGYVAPFEKYGIKFDCRVIVRLPKTLEKPEWNKELKKYEMLPNNIEVQEVPTDYEIDRDTFYAAIPVKRWVNANSKFNK